MNPSRKSTWPLLFLLLEVEQASLRDDLGGELGPRNAAPLHGDLHRALDDVEFASLLDGRLQAIGERGAKRRDIWRFDDPDRLIALEPDRQVQPRQGDELALGGGVELPDGTRPSAPRTAGRPRAR